MDTTRDQVQDYLRHLDRALAKATATIVLTVILQFVAMEQLVEFSRNGTSWLHPTLAMDLGAAAFGLLAVSVVSMWQVRKYLQSILVMLFGEGG